MNPGLGIWFKAEIIYNQKLFEYFHLKKKKILSFLSAFLPLFTLLRLPFLRVGHH